MSIKRRLSRLEKEANEGKTIPKSDRIAFVSTYGLDEAEVEAKIKKIEEEYMKKYGTTEGVAFFLSAVPDQDPPPDLNDPNARISCTEGLE